MSTRTGRLPTTHRNRFAAANPDAARIRNPQLRAFTLVEVLVTLMIGSLLVVSAVSATLALTTTRENVDRRVERSLAGRRAMEAVVAGLRNVRRDSTEPHRRVVGYSGGRDAGNDRIDLLVTSDVRVRPEGAESDQYELSFYLIRREGQRWPALVRRKDHALDEAPDDGGIVTVVAEGIAGLTFEYYGLEGWQPDWSIDQPRPPRAVRVTIQAAPDQGPAGRVPTPYTLSTVVPIHVTLPEPGADGDDENSSQRASARGGS
jgi:type II secretory pathway pseudopilin PulG